jgi:ascorbate-specific PTS system EIIC-type component UlaA
MIIDAIIQNLPTAATAAVLFLIFQRIHLQFQLHRAAQSRAEVFGGGRALEAYLLFQAVLFAATLSIIMAPVRIFASDEANARFLTSMAIALVCAVLLSLGVTALAKRFWPAFRRVHTAIGALNQRG